MGAARLRGRDVARKADLAAERVLPHLAAGRDRPDLDAPAGAEGRRAGGVDRPHELDLTRHRRRQVVDIERRPGEDDPVIGLEPAGVGQVRALVGRMGDVAEDALLDLLKRRGVGLGRRQAVGDRMALPRRARVALHHQNP